MIGFILIAATAPFVFTNLGEGTTTCGTWINSRREQPQRVLPEASWLLGYITASAKSDSARTGRKIARGINGAATDHWLDNYCAAHPLDNIETAATALVAELSDRAR